MKNKGFTLIEIISVIIIIGVIMVIAVPSVSNYISNAKAELVLTIQTGIRRINYMLIALSLVGILFIMFIVRRKRENS